MKKENKKNVCSYCSMPPVKYNCLSCDATGKIEMPENIIWNSDDISDFTIVGSCYIECCECDGNGWILLKKEDVFNENK